MPESVLWRTKAMQCEGIGMTWVAKLQSKCNEQIGDAEFETRAEMFPYNTPHTKEEMFYRKIFEKHYKGMDKFVHVWEGGCRAGGAPWKNAAYTREGLKDVKQLAKGLDIDTTKVDEFAAQMSDKQIQGETYIQEQTGYEAKA
jgi:asparagine synthase (glutamine-hydrolysing)